ncbi:hypothetical protein pb186bvf_006556 [Paramecium bursaria]
MNVFLFSIKIQNKFIQKIKMVDVFLVVASVHYTAIVRQHYKPSTGYWFRSIIVLQNSGDTWIHPQLGVKFYSSVLTLLHPRIYTCKTKRLLETNDIMESTWYGVYISILIMVGFLIPVAQFYYESDEEKSFGKRVLEVICYESILLVVLTILLFPIYLLLHFQYPLDIAASSPSNQSKSQTIVSIPTSFPVFCMGFMAFIGWFLFVLFGGVGLSALPMDLINEFLNRPKLIKSSDAASKKVALKQQAVALIEQGTRIKGIKSYDIKIEKEKEIELVNGYWNKRKQKSQVKTEAKKFEAAVLALQEEHEIFKIELDYMNQSPLGFVLKLIGGVIFAIMSILWWFQILLYMCIRPGGFPLVGFLNTMFTYLEKTVMSFLGTILLAFFSIYLLACTQKGNIKFGLKIPFLFTIHPMKVNETWMNSFLFNVNLILITSVAVTQFVCQAFSEYTQGTEISLMFSGQIYYLSFFTWFFSNNVFEITLLTWSAVVLIYLIVRPPQKSQALIDLENKQNKTSDIELTSK